MITPIDDFVKEYSLRGAMRMHMPGHKGMGAKEALDITEIAGADSLYEAEGIIAESEKNAGELFGATTYYSAEGSSLAIRAMVYLAYLEAVTRGSVPRILALRNCHKSFVCAAALLGVQVDYLRGDGDGYLSVSLTAEQIEEQINSARAEYTALYLTSPDYLGRMADVGAMARLCERRNMLLLVDNAHGAYLKFLGQSLHPIDLGAHMCADSAHKTLPVLTGGAYLHIGGTAPRAVADNARYALSLFGSTSPSYLILASLDRANAYISEGYTARLTKMTEALASLRSRLSAAGYGVVEGEPMKLTILPKSYGYRGDELAALLDGLGVVSEFADPDHLVLMPSAEQLRELDRLEEILLNIPRKAEITDTPPALPHPIAAMPPAQALRAPHRRVRVEDSVGCILGAITVGCPPAVPILLLGERIDGAAVACFKYYGIDEISVVEEK